MARTTHGLPGDSARQQRTTEPAPPSTPWSRWSPTAFRRTRFERFHVCVCVSLSECVQDCAGMLVCAAVQVSVGVFCVCVSVCMRACELCADCAEFAACAWLARRILKCGTACTGVCSAALAHSRSRTLPRACACTRSSLARARPDERACSPPHAQGYDLACPQYFIFPAIFATLGVPAIVIGSLSRGEPWCRHARALHSCAAPRAHIHHTCSAYYAKNLLARAHTHA